MNKVNEEQNSSGAGSESERHLTGRELDAAVAERVMGWVQIENALPRRMVGIPPESQTGFRNLDGTRPGRTPVPAYSTDIAAAMEVVDKFVWPVSVMMEHDRYYYDNEVQEGWRVTIRDPVKPVCAIYGTLPEAICNAALQSVASASALSTTEG